MKVKILEYQEKSKTATVEQQIELDREYKDYIVVESQFNEFIGYVIENGGKLPSDKSKDEKEKQLGRFRQSIKNLEEKHFRTGLSSSQLKYLHDSEYEGLREIYKEILYKAVINKIQIEYIDEEIKIKILEYQEKSKTATVKQQIELDREYKDYIVIESQFNEFIGYVIENGGKLPSTKSKNEKEKKLGRFRNGIKVIKKGEERFYTNLSSNQLKWLHDSDYEGLQEIYKEILYKAVTNHIEIEYIDEEIKTKVLEYKEKSKTATVEQQIELDREYKDYIVVESQFNEFIGYVIENDGKLPSEKSKDEKEKHLGVFRKGIKILKGTSFKTTLSSERLKYLHDSEYESLRKIYKEILYKAVTNQIQIDYIDENMKVKILEYKEKSKTATVEQQIELDREYKDYIVVESQFNEFIGYVIENGGKLPSKSSKDEKEKHLGRFRSNIKIIKKGEECFNTGLSSSQLKYLHDSEYESLREIYNTILQKAIENNIPIEYYPPEYEKQVEIHEFTEDVETQNLEETQAKKGR